MTLRYLWHLVFACKVKVIEMKALNFQKNDGEQNLRREIRNMEDTSILRNDGSTAMEPRNSDFHPKLSSAPKLAILLYIYCPRHRDTGSQLLEM